MHPECKTFVMRYRIILTAGTLMLLLLAFTLRDPFTVQGVVRDDQGKALPGAVITIKGTTRGTTADANGAFSLEVPAEGTILIVSYVGFEMQEVRATKAAPLSVKLQPAANAFQEVVVVGYSGSRAKNTTGANIRIRGAASLSSNNTLQGSAAGVHVLPRQKRSEQKSLSPYPDNGVMPQLEREGYVYIPENSFLRTTDNPLSTFSIDVDAASYSNIRRIIGQGQLPAPGAVRIEEMINYFKYDYPAPLTEDPFAVHTELATCPWNPEHRLAMIGIKGKQIPTDNLPASNLVFLIDVSGSMQDPQKLPLVKASMKLLVDQLRPQDRVAMVVYAGSAGLVLPSTTGSDKERIRQAIDGLEAGGSTAGGAGIKLAYQVAREHLREGGNNRVILCTDGDFNVGASSDDALVRMIEKERESGVFLTVLGYGMGNYQDAKMQQLADKGNGNHAYIDNLAEARKVLVSEFGGTLFTIAKDVKLQVEFNPALVQGYRLIGYENRVLAKEDFNNDRKDAGDLGSGHTVTALYEIIPVGVQTRLLDSVDALRYKPVMKPGGKESFGAELMTVKLRYKQPQGSVSKLLVQPVMNSRKSWAEASANFRFAASVAGFGMILGKSAYKGKLDFQMVDRMASGAMGADPGGYRHAFRSMVSDAAVLAGVALHLEK
jgi:Ca-activated chloride channel family protein